MSNNYGNKLRDPRWQKLRLRVMERDCWKCVACGRSNKTLNVHHIAYHENPWDTPIEDLQTLCEECHDGLGEHPRGGPYYLWETHDLGGVWGDSCDSAGDLCLLVAYRHCPMCGCSKDDSHSGCVGFSCQCGSISMPTWCADGYQFQTNTKGGHPAYLCVWSKGTGHENQDN